MGFRFKIISTFDPFPAHFDTVYSRFAAHAQTSKKSGEIKKSVTDERKAQQIATETPQMKVQQTHSQQTVIILDVRKIFRKLKNIHLFQY